MLIFRITFSYGSSFHGPVTRARSGAHVFCFSRRGPVTRAWTTARTFAVQLLPRRCQLAPESAWPPVPSSFCPSALRMNAVRLLTSRRWLPLVLLTGRAQKHQKNKNKCHSAAFTSTRDSGRMGRCVVAAVPRSGGGDARHATSYYRAAFTSTRDKNEERETQTNSQTGAFSHVVRSLRQNS